MHGKQTWRLIPRLTNMVLTAQQSSEDLSISLEVSSPLTQLGTCPITGDFSVFFDQVIPVRTGNPERVLCQKDAEL